jgi:hypothetical protein
MTRHGLPHGSRYHFPRHRSVASALGDATARCSRFEQPALHGGGHDHIGGGGGTPVGSGQSPYTVIALADGTRIIFATARAVPQF